MKPGGGKQKGAQFEREVCVALSRWILPESDETLFWRSAMSGGRATLQHRQGKKNNQAGDLSPIHDAGIPFMNHFVVECKRVAELNLRAAMIYGKGELCSFWDQVTGDAIKVDKHPFLIAQQNRFPILVFMRHSCAQPYFGMVSQVQLASFYRMDGYRVGMYLLKDLLSLPYKKDRFL